MFFEVSLWRKGMAFPMVPVFGPTARQGEPNTMDGKGQQAPLRRILRRREAALYLGVSQSALASSAQHGDSTYPRPIPLGRRAVGYDIHELDKWIEERR